ncbi:unnamed protein product [Rotaria sp. Silwood1]|nr:unnamed protein product [Rotaria sp. Silwood1]
MVAVGFASNIFSIDTFRHVQLRQTTVGIHLLVYSCCSLFGLLMLECRLFQLLDSLTYIPFFIICNVVSGLASIFTRICLWINELIALQRSLHSFEHIPLLNNIRSRAAASKQLLVIIICIFLMHVHELICRVTLPDPVAEGKFVCQIKYSTELLTLNTIFIFLHLFVPFSLNILANCLIMASISHRRATLHQTTYWSQWLKQFRRHGHLFLASTLAMVTVRFLIFFTRNNLSFSFKICTLSQLVLSLKFTCVDVTLKWLLRLNTSANLILYIPQATTFFVVICSSEAYFKVFRNESLCGRVLCLNRNAKNKVLHITEAHLPRNTIPHHGMKMSTAKNAEN